MMNFSSKSKIISLNTDTKPVPVQLMQEQPKIAQNTAPVPALSADEQQLIDDYRSLNEQGQEYIRQTMYMAKQTHKKMPDLSDLEKQA